MSYEDATISVTAAIEEAASFRPDLVGTPVGDYLKQVIAFNLAVGVPTGKLPITRENILKHPGGIPYLYGKSAYGLKRPKGIRKQRDKQCFENAFRLARQRRDLTYVEGYAQSLIACEHAWCVDADGHVIDPTWRDPKGKHYLGVAFDLHHVAEWLVRNGHYGVFGNFWRGAVTVDEIVAAIKVGET